MLSSLTLIFLWIPASTANAAALKPNGIKTFLVNGLSKFFNKRKPVFCNGPTNLPINSPDCSPLKNWVFYNFVLADELFPKVYQALKPFYQLIIIYVEINLVIRIPNNIWLKFKAISVPFFLPDFNLLSCEIVLDLN